MHFFLFLGYGISSFKGDLCFTIMSPGGNTTLRVLNHWWEKITACFMMFILIYSLTYCNTYSKVLQKWMYPLPRVNLYHLVDNYFCSSIFCFLFKSIRIEFNVFKVGVLSKDCPGNAVYIYDEFRKEEAEKCFCGDWDGWEWVTTGDEALLKLISDSSDTPRIFKMSISQVEKMSSFGKILYFVRYCPTDGNLFLRYLTETYWQ